MTNLVLILCVAICVFALAFLCVIFLFTKRINKVTEELYEAQNKNREMKQKNSEAFALLYKDLPLEMQQRINKLTFDNLNEINPEMEFWLIIKDGLYEAKDIRI